VCDGATTAVMLLSMLYVVSDYFSLPGSVSCTVLPCSISCEEHHLLPVMQVYPVGWTRLICIQTLTGFILWNTKWHVLFQHFLVHTINVGRVQNIFVVHKRKIIYRFSFFFFTSPLGLLCSKNIGSYLCSFIFSVCFS